MPNSEKNTVRNFSVYDTMDDEQLRQILRDDASNNRGEDTDLERMLYIMEVLAERRKQTQQTPSPEEALERFNKNYKNTDDFLISQQCPVNNSTKSWKRWQKWVAAAAAVLVVVLGTSLTAQAFGLDIFGIIAKWTKETFHLGTYISGEPTNAPAENDETPYQELHTVLLQNGIEVKLAPTWLPDGYEEVSVEVSETPVQRKIVALYANGEKSIRVRIADYLTEYPSQVEQSDELIETLNIDGVAYYIFGNYEQLRAVWLQDTYECYIIGNVTLEEMKEIIRSIGKG